LSLKATRKEYEKELTYLSTLTTSSGRPNDTKLTPCLDGKGLRWQMYGLSTEQKLTTDELADSLVKQLVNAYKTSQLVVVKGNV